MSGDPFAHCLGLLRQADPDRYLATLYLPEAPRRAAAAIYAFNSEIARIPALVSEPAPGEIRLHWWREAIGKKRDRSGNPVALELIDAIGRHHLPVKSFGDYLDARVFDLYHDPMPDQVGLEAWCGHTAGALLQWVALCAGAKPGPALADSCGHGGVAQAVAGLCRAAGALRANGRCYIPPEILASAGLEPGEWLAAGPDARHGRAVNAMALLAREHLAKARAAIAQLPRELRPVFLPLATVEPLLGKIARAGMGIFTAMPNLSPLHRHWRIGAAALRGMPF